nr:GMC oxidoreductase [Ruegeria marina]
MLTYPDDADLSLKGLRLALPHLAQPAPKGVLSKRCMPSADADSCEARINHVRASAGKVYHPVGTAKIGAAEDNTGVVDLPTEGAWCQRTTCCGCLRHAILRVRQHQRSQHHDRCPCCRIHQGRDISAKQPGQEFRRIKAA